MSSLTEYKVEMYNYLYDHLFWVEERLMLSCKAATEAKGPRACF